jgi:hypothetical protein
MDYSRTNVHGRLVRDQAFKCFEVYVAKLQAYARTLVRVQPYLIHATLFIGHDAARNHASTNRERRLSSWSKWIRRASPWRPYVKYNRCCQCSGWLGDVLHQSKGTCSPTHPHKSDVAPVCSS